MRYAAQVDENQDEIVQGLRRCGAWVYVTSRLGSGFPDILVWFRNRFVLMEIKNPKQDKNKRALTPAEQRFFFECPGPCVCIETLEQALEAIGSEAA